LRLTADTVAPAAATLLGRGCGWEGQAGEQDVPVATVITREAHQSPVRVNITCVTPLGDVVASIS
jgi:hypothetical protein